jgi:plastocyanin
MKKFTYGLFTMTLLVGMAFNTSLFAVTHTVQVGNYYFNPSTLNVEVGDIVKWVWVAGTHTTTSSSIPAGASSWDEAITSGNQTYSYNVTTAGTYNYVCTPHVGMGMVASFVATAAANTLQVTPPSQTVTESAGTTDFTVTSNTSWTASSDVTWCTVTASGSGNGTIMATYDKNNTTTERTANITVSVSGLSPVIVQVLQDGSTVGISEKTAVSIRFFPNPAKDVVKITLNNHSDNTRISLLDLTGKIIIDRFADGNNEVSLEVGDLPRGYYLVRVINNGEAITRRLVLAD